MSRHPHLAPLTLSTLFALALALALGGCGGEKPPKDPSSPAEPAAEAKASSETPPEPEAAKEPEPPKKRRPYEIHSSCNDVVNIVFGEDPKSPKAGKQTIAPGATISDGPRDADGNQTIWLVDDAGEGLVKVHVTRGMKRVEVGKSCRTLDAR